MHRSGTSSLAGSLQEAGLHLGDVITAAPHNLKGNRENKRIMDLHEAVLVHSGGSWDDPPARAVWSDAHRAERASILESYGDAALWGFKCPRTLFILDFWREVLPEIAFVGTLRHPQLVADSLFRRNGATMEKWLTLWADYAERLVALHAAQPFPIVRFDVGEHSYRRSLQHVIEMLDLPGRESLQFFEPALRHDAPSSSANLPDRVKQLYESLCAVALAP
jgi:hypothetical protein